MADTEQTRELEFWLTTPSMTNSGIEHQDGEWVIATIYRIRDALPVLDRTDCVAERRDSVIYALIVQLMSLLDPQETAGPYAVAERDDVKDALLNWARTNWSEVLRIDKEMGLGADYDTIIVPHMPPEFQREYQRLLEVAREEDRVRVSRNQRRRAMNWLAIVVGLGLAISFGVPLSYAGYVLIGLGVLWLLDFRVSWGGASGW